MIFLSPRQNTPELSKCSPIRRVVRRSGDYTTLKTFLQYFYLQRFGGVGAPDGRQKVPDISYHIFLSFNFCVCPARMDEGRTLIFS